MEFADVIKFRKSIRNYSDKEVEEEKIIYILESARLAPSWVNTQCWHFIVVKNKETIKLLSKTSIINRWLENAPVVIAACANPKSSGIRNDIEYFAVDVAIAMEHLILAATDVGLGSCWIAGFDEKKVRDILNIPERIKVVSLTPIGYSSQKKTIQGSITKAFTQGIKRKRLDEIVHYERW